MTPPLRGRIATMVQTEHDDCCYDYSCKCHEREWNSELESYVSGVAVAEADALIAEIEDAAVRKYRGVPE